VNRACVLKVGVGADIHLLRARFRSVLA